MSHHRALEHSAGEYGTHHRSLRQRLWKSLLALLLLGLTGGLAVQWGQAARGDAANPVIAAWELAQQRGSYAFGSDVVQVTTPLATTQNVGRTSRQQQLRIEGETNLASKTMGLRIWNQEGSISQAGSALEIKIVNGQTMARKTSEDWQPIDDVTGAFAPSGDFMTFLAGLQEVEKIGSETRNGQPITRYRFVVDGPAVAEYVRNETQRTLTQRGDIPLGTELQTPAHYAQMTGVGEFWISEDGLPLRQILDLTFPAQRKEVVRGRIDTIFTNFAPATSLLPQTPAEWLGRSTSLFVTYFGALFFPALGLAFVALVVRRRRSRTIYAALVIATLFGQVAGPLLQKGKYVQFLDGQTARAQDNNEQKIQEEMTQTAAQLLGETGFDPLQDPLAEDLSANALTAAATHDLTLPVAETPEPLLALDNGADSDGDGLTDFLEERIGTSTTISDTDGDLVSDGVEVLGFHYAGHQWFSDPLRLDSNNDGQADTLELKLDLNNDNIPDDSDNDGTPDAFDNDNDGDGVIDKRDLSPYSKLQPGAGNTFFDQTTPLQLSLNNLQAGKPVYVDFQIRPKNDKHLWYALNVLDWPHDTQGQFQDGDNATYADTVSASLPGANPVANPADANGDMKLIPLLEIRMASTSANLPSDADLLAYSISLNELTSDGSQQVAYVPLRLIYDAESGMRVAFEGRMPYLATGNWADPHAIRLVWVVQALSDNCAEQVDGVCVSYAAYNQPQIIQSYYDEFVLTGLTVREEHGSEVAIIHEDPTVDNNLKNDGPLFALSHVLDETFLGGRDQDKNGQPDITVAEIERRFNHTANENVSIAERWEISDTLSIKRRAYDTADRAMMTTAMTETIAVLNHNFTSFWQTDNTLKPLLMFAREDRYRSQGMDGLTSNDGYISFAGGLVKVDLQPANQPKSPLNLSVGLKWTMFCSPTGTLTAWQPCAVTTTWDELGARYANFSRLEGDTEEMTLGRMGLIRFYFMALAEGVANLIQQDATIIVPDLTGLQSDDQLIASLRGAARAGATVVALVVNVAMISRLVLPLALLKAAAIGAGPAAGDELSRLGTTGLTMTKIKQMWDNGGKTRVIVSAVIVAVILVATIATFAVLQASDDPLLNKVVTGAIVVAVVLASIYSLVNAITTTVQIAKGLILTAGSLKAISLLMRANSGVAGTTRAFGIVGAILQVAIVWGFFIYQMVDSKTSAFSPEFNDALAQAIAATILIITLAVLSATVIGLLIVAIIALIDAILTAICELGVDELRQTPGLGGACFTLNTAATAVIAKLIYSYDSMIDTARGEMITTGAPDITVADPLRGFVSDNPLTIKLPVTTTITHKDPEPENWMHILPYIWLFSKDNIRSTTFHYELARRKDTLEVERNEMDDHWTVTTDHTFAGKAMYRGQARQEPSIANLMLPAGLNRSPQIYFNTGYALPAYECWTVPNPIIPFVPPAIPICYTRTLNGDNATRLEQFKLDIMPATLDGFMSMVDTGDGGLRLGWSPEFRPLFDADGDGLRVRAEQGIDPNDASADADGDGLSDGYEIEWRAKGIPLSPIVWDSDSDGLADAQELQLGSNPAIKDTDNDGLLDGEELYHRLYMFDPQNSRISETVTWAGGWTIAITGTQPFNQIVSSDPTSPDTDLDGISDQAEKELATHPDVSKRLDPDGRPYHPLLINQNPLVVFVTVDDLDRIVRPGQSFVYSTSVTNLGAPFSAGGLEVNAPALLGAPLSTHKLELDLVNHVTKQTNFTVAEDAISQALNINSFARARLVNLNPVPWQWLSPTVSALTDFDKTPYSAAVVPSSAGRQDIYVLTSSMRNRYGTSETAFSPHLVYRGDVRAWGYPGGETGNLENDHSDTSSMRTQGAPDVACNLGGKCFYVWDQYENCDPVTVKSLLVTESTEPEADIALYFKQDTRYLAPGVEAEPRIYEGENIPTDQSQNVNATVQFCSRDASIEVWEWNGSGTPTSNPESGTRMASLPRTGYNQHTWTYEGTVEGDDFVVVLGVEQPRSRRNVVAGVISGQTPTTLGIKQLLMRDPDEAGHDYSPVVASDGLSFLVAWERVSAVSDGGPWTMSSQIVTRLFDGNGDPLGDEQALTPEVAVVTTNFSPSSYLDLDVAWVGDAYRVAWQMAGKHDIKIADFAATGAVIANSQRAIAKAYNIGGSAKIAYDPNSGKHLIAYRNPSLQPVGLLMNNRSDTGTSIALGAAGMPRVSYHPAARGWLSLLGVNGDTFTYKLLNPDGSMMANLKEQTGPWGSTTTYNSTYDLACPMVQSQPVLALPFEELPGATAFADTSGNSFNATCAAGSCPLAGASGAPGAPLSDYGVHFNGSGQRLTTSNLNKLAGRLFSATFWLNPATLSGDQMILDGGNWSARLLNDKIVFRSGATEVTSQALPPDGGWVHVALTQFNLPQIYLNGQLAGTNPGVLATLAPGAVTLGSKADGSAGFHGTLDHLQLFNTALDQPTIAAIYNRTLNSYCLATASHLDRLSTVRLNLLERDVRGGVIKASAGLSLTVDAIAPTSTVDSLVDGAHIQGVAGGLQTIIIGGNAHDGFGIEKVEVSVDNGPFQPANGAATWTFALTVGEGSHTIRSRATDVVGNVETAIQTKTIIVDGSAPQVSFADGQFVSSAQASTTNATSAANSVLTPVRGADDRWRVFVPGTVVDGASGVALVELLLQSTDLNTAGNAWQVANLNAGQWSLNYEFAPEISDVSGIYTFTVRAIDQVGNVAEASKFVELDASGPLMRLDAKDANRSIIDTDTSKVNGVAADNSGAASVQGAFTPIQQVLAYSDTLLLLSFEEAADAIWFNDRTTFDHDVICAVAGCAQNGDPGRNGKAVKLNGSGALQLPDPNALNIDEATSLSIQVWLRTQSADAAFLGKVADGVGYRLLLQDGRVVLQLNGAALVTSGNAINDNQWHQVVAVVDRASNQAQIFVDGILQGAAAFSGSLLNQGQLALGGPGFNGSLDEVAVINAALTPFLVQSLFATVASTVLIPAALTQPGASNTAWSLNVPLGLEGQYQLDLLGSDNRNNRALAGYAWRGLIDTLSPRITFTATATGKQFVDTAGATKFEISYSYTAEDRYLTDSGFAGPCDGKAATVRDFADDAAMGGLFPDLTLRNRLSASCVVWETSASPAVKVKACDLYENCAEEGPGQTRLVNGELSRVAGQMMAAAEIVSLDAEATSAVIVAPTANSILAVQAETGIQVTVNGKAAEALKEIVILLDNNPVQTINFAQTDAVKSVQRTVTVPVANLDSFEGTHTLAARASEWNGSTQQTLTLVTFNADTRDPLALLANDKLTGEDAYALGNSIMRLRGTASDPGTQASGLAAVQLSVNDGAFTDVTFDKHGNWRTAAYLGDEPAGKTFTFKVRASDLAGRTTDVVKTLVVEVAALALIQTTINGAPASPTSTTRATFVFSGQDNTGKTLSNFLCQLDGSDFTACTSPVNYTNLADGEHTFRVLASDGLGNIDPSPATHIWTVDRGFVPTNPAPTDTVRKVYLPTIARSMVVVASEAVEEVSSEAVDKTVQEELDGAPMEDEGRSLIYLPVIANGE